MKLIPNAQKVLRHAWSVRWMIAAVVFSVAEVLVPLFFYQIPKGMFAALTVISTAGGLISRFLMQKELDR